MNGFGLICFAVGWMCGAMLKEKEYTPEKMALHFFIFVATIALGLGMMVVEQDAVCLGLRSV